VFLHILSDAIASKVFDQLKSQMDPIKLGKFSFRVHHENDFLRISVLLTVFVIDTKCSIELVFLPLLN
jgi:hypothetical protein